MTKHARKAGNIIFVLVISFLLIMGCLFASDTIKVKTDNTNLDNMANTLQTTADKSYNVSGENTWKAAIDYAVANPKSNVLIKLTASFNAQPHQGFVQSFNINTYGEGFSNGRLRIPPNTNIILDLNGCKINRNFPLFNPSSGDNDNGSVFIVEGTLRLFDSKFDSKTIYDLDETNSIKNRTIGRIINGGSNLGGGLYVKGGKVYMYGGAIVGNNARDGGAIFCTSGGEVNIYDGIIAENNAQNGGAIGCVGESKINIYGGHIFKNTALNQGGGIHCYDINLNINGGKFTYNQAVNGGAIYLMSYASSNTTVIKNAILHYNTARFIGGAIFASSLITFDGIDIRYNQAEQGSAIGEIYGKITLRNSTIIDNRTTEDSYALQLSSSFSNGLYLSIGEHVIITNNKNSDNKEKKLYLEDSKYYLGLFERALNCRIGLTVSGKEILMNYNYPTDYHEDKAIGSIFYKDEDGSVKGSAIRYNLGNYEFSEKQPTVISGAKWEHNGYTTVDESGYVEVPYRSDGYSVLYSSSSGTNLGYNLSTGFTDYNNSIAHCQAAGIYVISAGATVIGFNITRISTIIFRILPKELTVEWGANSLVYNTAVQKVDFTISGLESGETCTPILQTIFGGKNVGTGVCFANEIPMDNYGNKNYQLPLWDRVKVFNVTPRYLDRPEIINNTPVFANVEQCIILSNYDKKYLSALEYQTNVGKYTQTISIKSPGNCYWKTTSGSSSGTDTSTLTFDWEIKRKSLAKPTGADVNTLIFNNAEQTYLPSGFDNATMVIENNVNSAVGEYTAKVTPNSNHQWSDGTTTAIEFKYRILPPGIVVKDGVNYDYLYIDSNNIRQSYGNSYMHKLNDENLNIVNGVSKYVLGNIPVNTSIEVFLNNLQSDRNLIKIYAKESDITPIYDGLTGTRNNLSKTLATGSKVELYSNSTDTTPFDTIYLSVLGDVTGDGRITASDVAYLRQVANDSQALESMSIEKRLAGMINNKGGITEIDSEILRNYIDKQIDINKFLESETESTNTGYTYLTLDRDNMLRKVSESKTNVIGNISVNTSVEMLKTKLAEMGINISSLTIYNRKGYEVSDNTAIVGTGWRIEVGGEVTYLSVLGDLTGDGRITAADISYLRAIAASDTTNVQECILLSAILLNKGGITTADSEVLKQAIKGSILLSEYNN